MASMLDFLETVLARLAEGESGTAYARQAEWIGERDFPCSAEGGSLAPH